MAEWQHGGGICPDFEDNSIHMSGVNSAYAAHRRHEEIMSLARVLHAKEERTRKAEEATIELNGETKKQNEYLKAQLNEAQKSNALLTQQLNAQVSAGLKARVIAGASLLVAIGSLAFTIWRTCCQ